jgi:hypothetical protein
LIVPEQIIIERGDDGCKSNCMTATLCHFTPAPLAVIGFERVATVSNLNGNFTLS